MIPLTTDVRLKRGIPRAVMGIIVGTFILHVVVQGFIDFGVVEPNFRSKWMTLDFANPNPFDWFLALFSHATYWHWFGNMLYLWIFGSILEDRLGSLKFFLLFLFCGAVSGLIYFGMCYLAIQLIDIPMPHLRTLGASGAISGIMGLAMYRFSKAKVLLSFPSIGFLMFFSRSIPIWIFCLYKVGGDLLGLFSDDNVAHMAHIGGFLGGLIAGRYLGLKKENQEELFMESATNFREAKMYKDAAEKYEQVLALNPNNALARQELGFCYWGMHNPTKTNDPYWEKSRQQLTQALELYLKEEKHHEALELYEKLMKYFKAKDFPEKIQFLLNAHQKGQGLSMAVLTSDPEEKKKILLENFKGQAHRGSYQAAYQTLQEYRMLVEPENMEAPILELAGETSLRVSDQKGAETYFERLSKSGDVRQTVRALTTLSRNWLRTPRQMHLAVLYRHAEERVPDVRLSDEWVQLGEQLKQ